MTRGRFAVVALWVATAIPAIVIGLSGLSKLVEHPGSHYFRGRQAGLDYREPLVYAGILACVAIARWRRTSAAQN